MGFEWIVAWFIQGSMGDTIRDREQVLVNRAQRTPDGVFPTPHGR